MAASETDLYAAAMAKWNDPAKAKAYVEWKTKKQATPAPARTAVRHATTQPPPKAPAKTTTPPVVDEDVSVAVMPRTYTPQDVYAASMRAFNEATRAPADVALESGVKAAVEAGRDVKSGALAARDWILSESERIHEADRRAAEAAAESRARLDALEQERINRSEAKGPFRRTAPAVIVPDPSTSSM